MREQLQPAYSVNFLSNFFLHPLAKIYDLTTSLASSLSGFGNHPKFRQLFFVTHRHVFRRHLQVQTLPKLTGNDNDMTNGQSTIQSAKMWSRKFSTVTRGCLQDSASVLPCGHGVGAILSDSLPVPCGCKT